MPRHKMPRPAMNLGASVTVPAIDIDWIGHGILVWPVRPSAWAETFAPQQDCLQSGGLADPVAAGNGARQQLRFDSAAPDPTQRSGGGAISAQSFGNRWRHVKRVNLCTRQSSSPNMRRPSGTKPSRW